LLSNSRLAIEAAGFAQDAGKFSQFHRAVLAAYFASAQDIGDIEVLAAVADGVGLDPVLLRRELSGGAYADEREVARTEAAGLGITAVPTYVFPEGTRAVGAQSLDYFRRLLEGVVASAD
jgi:predicted DsbA family dithiol-disulfide isomerase